MGEGGKREMSSPSSRREIQELQARPASLTSVCGRIKQQILLGTFSRCVKGNSVPGGRQQVSVSISLFARLYKSKFYLSNVTGFYNEISESVEKWRAADVVYLDFNKASDTISHSPPLTTLERYELG